MSYDLSVERHKEWLGFVQPVGLVVSTLALKKAQAAVNKNIADVQVKLKQLINEEGEISDINSLFTEVLNWQPDDLRSRDGQKGFGDQFDVNLIEFEEVLSPDFVVFDIDEETKEEYPLILIKDADNESFDDLDSSTSWEATYSDKFERILRETKVPIGIMYNKNELRLFYAPEGESSGHLTFTFSSMTEVMARPILSAFYMLLNENRIFSGPTESRLKAILSDSRKYQNEVSTKLSEQVLAGLYELLRGFQEADDYNQGKLLKEILKNNPNKVYEGLITVLLRTVFVLYAEDRNLISDSEVYSNFYSVSGLFERLREDASQHPDTMDSRYGAWAQLLSLFRLIYNGIESSNINLPARHGHLFDPDRFPFLEGIKEVDDKAINVPQVSDGCIFRVLSNLLILAGERLSYRTLDVEQIGSVYETVMGFNLEISKGRSIAIKAKKKHGAPVTINLDELLKVKGKDRAKWLTQNADQKITGNGLSLLKDAESIDGLVEALGNKIAKDATPNIVPKDKMIFQPSDERRKSGSHYTPRELTAPIVETALRPIFERLGENPKPEDILELKVCDPAMGSGAFLVEACRHLAEKLVKSWHYHQCLPEIPIDESEHLYAMRVIAQRCLYGVDKNPMAVDLAKLSLWLVTLAKEHAFTFLDHSLKHGDSLVGLNNDQIASFSFKKDRELPLFAYLKEKIVASIEAREEIQSEPDTHTYDSYTSISDEYLEKIKPLKAVGDLLIKCFFDGKKERERQELVSKHEVAINNFFAAQDDEGLLDYCEMELLKMGKKIAPFHWELEFPEVFRRNNGGFDCFIGNPPFLGGMKITSNFGKPYLEWLCQINPHGGDRADLVAYFFYITFRHAREHGTCGLISTNTISQTDTRDASLAPIVHLGGTIYNAVKRFRWPGAATVVVSHLHIYKGTYNGLKMLENLRVDNITTYLLSSGPNNTPKKLEANRDLSFYGANINGKGFVFQNGDSKATPLSVYEQILNEHPEYSVIIKPYIGGEEINKNPDHKYERYVIDFGEMKLDDAKKFKRLFEIVEDKVWPERKNKTGAYKEKWWQFGRKNLKGREKTAPLDKMLVTSRVNPNLSFTFTNPSYIVSDSAVIFALDSYSYFAVMQSTIHISWAYFFASTMKDDLRYTPTACFETFPFPDINQHKGNLDQFGKQYFDFRSRAMIEINEGMTKLYNRFNDPDDSSPHIESLRKYCQQMDQSVLESYGWGDIDINYDFILDYEEDDDDSASSKKKKPWRYKFTPEVHDEILARLLKLNQERYEAEVKAGLHKKK